MTNSPDRNSGDAGEFMEAVVCRPWRNVLSLLLSVLVAFLFFGTGLALHTFIDDLVLERAYHITFLAGVIAFYCLALYGIISAVRAWVRSFTFTPDALIFSDLWSRKRFPLTEICYAEADDNMLVVGLFSGRFINCRLTSEFSDALENARARFPAWSQLLDQLEQPRYIEPGLTLLQEGSKVYFPARRATSYFWAAFGVVALAFSIFFAYGVIYEFTSGLELLGGSALVLGFGAGSGFCFWLAGATSWDLEINHHAIAARRGDRVKHLDFNEIEAVKFGYYGITLKSKETSLHIHLQNEWWRMRLIYNHLLANVPALNRDFQDVLPFTLKPRPFRVTAVAMFPAAGAAIFMYDGITESRTASLVAAIFLAGLTIWLAYTLLRGFFRFKSDGITKYSATGREIFWASSKLQAAGPSQEVQLQLNFEGDRVLTLSPFLCGVSPYWLYGLVWTAYMEPG